MGFDLLGLEWPLLPVWHGIFADAAKVRFPPEVQDSHVCFGLEPAICLKVRDQQTGSQGESCLLHRRKSAVSPTVKCRTEKENELFLRFAEFQWFTNDYASIRLPGGGR